MNPYNDIKGLKRIAKSREKAALDVGHHLAPNDEYRPPGIGHVHRYNKDRRCAICGHKWSL